jgi:hypothetical protein
MLSNHQLRDLIVRPCLQALHSYSQAYEDLLVGTFAHESRYGSYLKQIGGPALGFWQEEPETYYDLAKRYSVGHSATWLRLMIFCGFTPSSLIPPPECLIYNINLSCSMALLKYMDSGIIAEKLPTDIESLAKFYKIHYNSIKGSATTKEFIDDYKMFCCVK